jgi:hypothetical protein
VSTLVTWRMTGRDLLAGDAIAASEKELFGRAVILEHETCFDHEDCNVFAIAPDATTTVEHVHIGDTTAVMAERILR